MTWKWPFSDTISQKFISLKFFLLCFICFGMKYFVLSIKGRRSENQPEIAGQGVDDWTIDTDKFILELIIFLWTQVYSFALKITKILSSTVWKSQGGKDLPNWRFSYWCRNYLILHISKTWECYIISILSNMKYKERPARFEIESSENLKKEFIVSVKDDICIITSDMIVYIIRRGQLFSCRSRQYTIWKIILLLFSIETI